MPLQLVALFLLVHVELVVELICLSLLVCDHKLLKFVRFNNYRCKDSDPEGTRLVDHRDKRVIMDGQERKHRPPRKVKGKEDKKALERNVMVSITVLLWTAPSAADRATQELTRPH